MMDILMLIILLTIITALMIGMIIIAVKYDRLNNGKYVILTVKSQTHGRILTMKVLTESIKWSDDEQD